MAASQVLSGAEDSVVTIFCWIPSSNFLQHLKSELDDFAAYHEAKILLPKAAKSAAMIHQKFKTKKAPDAQQFDVNPYRTHPHFGVPHVAAVHSSGKKIIERVGIQVPAMSGIAE